MLQIAEKLHIKEPADWYNVSKQQVVKVAEKLPWRDNYQLSNILNKCYDGFVFNPDNFRTTKKSQNYVKKLLEELFPDHGNLDLVFSDVFNVFLKNFLMIICILILRMKWDEAFNLICFFQI